ncbi:agmatinase [bacterium]|nr:agmatinase [bacterium]
MFFETAKKSFLGINNKKDLGSKVVVVPFGLENTVTYGRGTKKGPREIIKASHQIELFDEDLGYEISDKTSIETLKIKPINKNTPQALSELENITLNIIKDKKFPLILGGEHTLTLGAISALNKSNKPITIIQFDAHTDLRNSYQSKKYSHACVMRRCLDLKNTNLISIGIRSTTKDEMSFIKKNNSRVHIFFAKDKKEWDLKRIEKLVRNKNVYITFDVDAFDPSLVPATGTPEPGGLYWDETINLLKIITSSSNIIGSDINELAPIQNHNASNFIVAKLAYKLIGLVFNRK